MTYQRFEDLPVWKDGAELARRIYELTSHTAFQHQYGLVSQLQRAAISVSSNIAEGFEHGTQKELCNYLHIARGSVGEVRSILLVISPISAFSETLGSIQELIAKSESISRQLAAWTPSLKQGERTGARQKSFA